MPQRSQEGTEWTDETEVTNTDVIVIGTGFSGLGMGVSLAREGTRTFTILERAHDVGGTWRDNTYPGAACDIQSHLYSFSFRPNPHWSRVFATQPEILQYLQSIAAEEELLPHIRFGTEVQRAEWDEPRRRWVVTTPEGRHVARSLITATGHLSDPVYPDLDGLDTFAGELFHSARWNHEIDLTGKRVGVIGTGASAIQIVPEVAKVASKLVVFQRTPPYVLPRMDRIYSATEKNMFLRLPETRKALRNELFWGNEARFPARRGVPAFIDQIARAASDHLESQVPDPVLRAKLTPSYEIGCKRILLSNDYFPTLCQPHVDLEASGIARVEPTGIITSAGEEVDLDVLIVATGFEATDLPIAHRVFGRDGEALSDHWSTGGRAFACTTVSGFPNLFVMLGPNTGLGAGSMVYMVETQVGYISEALRFLDDEVATIEPDPQAEEEFVADIDRRARGTVWLAGGCSSWYVDPRSNRLSSLWPDFMNEFRRRNGSFSPDGYRVEHMSTTSQSDPGGLGDRLDERVGTAAK